MAKGCEIHPLELKNVRHLHYRQQPLFGELKMNFMVGQLISFPVKRQDVLAGNKFCYTCPVALASNQHFQGVTHVSAEMMSFYYENVSKVFRARLNDETRENIRIFDETGKMPEFMAGAVIVYVGEV